MSHNIRNFFSAGIVNTDADKHFVSDGQLTKAENVDIFQSGADGVVTPIKGNVLKEGKLSGTDEYLGSAVWKNLIYLFYTTATDNYIREYNTDTDTYATVIKRDLGLPLTGEGISDKVIIKADVISDEFLYWVSAQRQSDGSLISNSEPKRIHIADAKAAPTTYTNVSNNLDKPNKLVTYAGLNPEVTNNLLKHNSYIFYARYINKYNERTVLSYPSNCIDVSVGVFEADTPNYIFINGFTVPDDVESVEFFMSNDSTATLKQIYTYDSRVNKNFEGFEFFNDYEYPVLDDLSSSVINYEYPLSAVEQEVVENSIVYGNVGMTYDFVDEDGTIIDKSSPFSYTSEGLTYSVSEIFNGSNDPPTTTVIDVTATFVNGQEYKITYRTYIPYTAYGETIYLSKTYIVNYLYTTGDDYAQLIEDLLVAAGCDFANIQNAAGDHNFTVVNASNTAPEVATFVITTAEKKYGLNSDFKYKGGIVFLDDKGRNLGVSNVTPIEYVGSESIFSVKTNIPSTKKPPHWATKYMLVRDKVNTNLCYGVVGSNITSGADKVYAVKTPYYTDYIGSYRGKEIIVYSKDLNKDVSVEVLTIEQRTALSLSESGDIEYISLESTEGTITENSLILFKPVKDVDSDSEVFYETSDVFDITDNGDGTFTYGGNDVILNWYDTKYGRYNKRYGTSTTVTVLIMKTDIESLRDINHLGRGAYNVIKQTNINYTSTLVHSQKYEPSTNFNGLNILSSYLVNYKDLDLRYGAIEKLYYDDTNLLVGQRNKWRKVLIDKSLLYSVSGDSTVQKSNTFFNDVIDVAGDFGITDKRSFASYGFRQYFVDQDRGVIGRLSMDGITIINGLKEFDIRGMLKSHSRGGYTTGAYDPVKQEYVVAFDSISRILRFSEKAGGYTEYSWDTIPRDLIQVDDSLYSISSGNNSLYLENVGTVLSIYGTIQTPKIGFVVNKEPNVVKDYLSMSVQSTIPFNIVFATSYGSTSLTKTKFMDREGVWYADVPRDSSSKGKLIFGVGEFDSVIDAQNIKMKSNVVNLRSGDEIYRLPSSNIVGTVTSYNGVYISVDSILSTPLPSEVIYTVRPQSVEGKVMKGEYLEVELSSDTDEDFKLFSVNTVINVSSHLVN